jgi:superfamily II DNA/RNA helicase
MKKKWNLVKSDVVLKKQKVDNSFECYSLDALLVQALVLDCQFKEMTLAQKETIVGLLAGHDMHLQSKTGSGKTAAFLVPSLQKIMEKREKSFVKLLVISPTRELAMQIAKDAQLFTKYHGHIKCGIAIGGTNINTEKKAIQGGLDILIATPGRLLDHLSSSSNILDRVKTFVLDECDRAGKALGFRVS